MISPLGIAVVLRSLYGGLCIHILNVCPFYCVKWEGWLLKPKVNHTSWITVVAQLTV